MARLLEALWYRLDTYRRLRSAVCFFRGHGPIDEEGPGLGGWRCWYCYYEENRLRPTLPDFLYRMNVWLVEHSALYAGLFDWLCETIPSHWPWPKWLKY